MTSFIHQEELLERVENDRELLRELLSIFKDEFPQRYQALRQAVQSLDVPRVVLEAHSLKGMLSNLAAREAAAAVAHLESVARKGETARFRESFAHFENMAGALTRQLDSFMAKVSG
jgi:two-component system, sensor histidine kinase and response regulator